MTHDVFAAHRPRLLGVAYGILGELPEAEDVVQDAWLRWQAADRDEVRDATGFLITTTTRLAIDRLRSARARRETYVGTWLPDPLVSDPDDPDDPAVAAIEAERLSVALLVALERLNPVERAVLVLRDAFDLEYAEIADALQLSPGNARQIAKRARDRIGDDARRRPIAPEEQQRLLVAFMAAAHAGDVDVLRELLAADAIQFSDGGGHGNVARTPIAGAEQIARFYAGVRRTGAMPRDLVPQLVRVNGEIGVRLTSRAAGQYAITLLDVADGRIVAIRNFANPARFAGDRTGDRPGG
ncbi:RNA polymerase sigma factor SigJ [Conexibacter woesei]|uniref:RNA polymerase, sigma-24 subunit, ECF subfamily n=1 Tax=Conexibacter woesei (strain DSM 14684 / CCUG 47730 / CIP 108061 / JCM 11494 / NBRC 100937 / ID131577) TaxID=469383 RepID=D3FBC5_CONWI|nr:RNA polymerase sigma factor SigJ [Conexibacter woesei]ADB49294.1 RNA polymerase, sigma-24 subunit, ECF subfamily [Conexibacter woesei DSM 14684]